MVLGSNGLSHLLGEGERQGGNMKPIIRKKNIFIVLKLLPNYFFFVILNWFPGTFWFEGRIIS